MSRAPTVMALLVAALVLAGCERIMQNMYDQPRDKPFSQDPFFEDGAATRVPPTGTVPYSRGAEAEASSGRSGTRDLQRNAEAEAANSQPYPLDGALLARGRDRYGIYCLPCHSPVGDGDGRIVRRGFPAPPSYHIDRLRNAPDRHFYDVISDGYGIMASYGDRVMPPDRWAIVAYIRALQLSQYAKVDDLPAALQKEAQDGLRKTAQGGTP